MFKAIQCREDKKPVEIPQAFCYVRILWLLADVSKDTAVNVENVTVNEV